MKELFPKVSLLQGKSTSLGFYHDFHFPFKFEKSILKQIEERMLSSVLKKEKVLFREMVPYSATQYFLSRRESFLVDLLRDSCKSTISLFEIAGQMFLTEAKVGINNLGEIGSIKILKEETLQRGVIRIHGTAFPTKNELKDFFKVSCDWVGKPHQVLGEQKGLFSFFEPLGCCWLPKGLKLRSKILGKIEELIVEKQGVLVSTKSGVDNLILRELSEIHYEIFESRATGKSVNFLSENVTVCNSVDNDSASGLLNSSCRLVNISHVFCQESFLLEEVISCLHFVTKIFKILGFAFRIVLVEKSRSRNKWLRDAFLKVSDPLNIETEEDSLDGSRIEWRVQDRMGLEWPVSCVYAPKKTSGKDLFFSLPFSLFISLERVIALIVEKSKQDCFFD